MTDAPCGPWRCRGREIWAVLCAARDGNVLELERLLETDPNLHRAEYWYTQPVYLAVREGRLDATRLLLEAGAEPGWRNLAGDSLMTVALERKHAEIVLLLESHARRSVVHRTVETAIHDAAEADDVAVLRTLLAGDAQLLHAADSAGLTPLHRAVASSARGAVEFLLAQGADPNWPEGPAAPKGGSLYAASAAGDREMVEQLLAQGADPNATIDSAGSPTYAARTPELRALLEAHGGRLDPYDLVFLGEDQAARRLVEGEPRSAASGCGGVLAAACKLSKRGLLEDLLALGVRVPSVLTACRSYLWSDPALLRLLLSAGMDPDLPDWQHATPLHSLCERDSRGRPRPHRAEVAHILLEAGASISAREEDYRSTPLGFAARNGLDDMVDLLLSQGAPPQLKDDPQWASPLTWARSRGHETVVRRLRDAGATA